MRGANLTHRLLAFARRQVLMPKQTNVTELIRSMQPLLQQPLGPRIVTTFRLVDDAWPVEVDQSQLEISVLNLTLNARDAMPEGGQLIISTSNATITTQHAFSPDSIVSGDYVVISVSDNGCGMSEQVKACAFDPFFTTKEVGKGTGLGLSMVYGFAMQSGGNVQIQSQIGSGTTVSLYLPRSQGLSAPRHAEENGTQEIQRRHLVLLVEDEADVRDLVLAYLEGLGYSVVLASDGPSALVVLGAHPEIDLLLTDVILPGAMDGVAIAARVRAERPEIKVVYMSGYAPEAEKILGGSQILNKPFGKSELAKALSTALDIRRTN
jgi:CheY-like chemotaxis protein